MLPRNPHPPLSVAERFELTISYALKIIVLITIISSVVIFDMFLFASSLIILVFSALPALVERQMRITLPVEVDFVLTAFIFAHFMLGEAANYYIKFWWYDLALHVSSGILIGLVGFTIIYFFLYTRRVDMNPPLVVLFSVSFSLAAGALWEIFEFFMDMTLGFNMQKSGLMDTMSDLIVDLLGACIVGFWSYRYLTKNEDGIIKTVVMRLIQYNVRLRKARLDQHGANHQEGRSFRRRRP